MTQCQFLFTIIIMASQQILFKCAFCPEVSPKYKCSKCELRYCSSSCYRCPSHSGCSETFFRDCIMDELKSQTCSHESKQKMIEILQRQANEMNEEEDIEDELDLVDEDDLAERLSGIDIEKEFDFDVIWNRLNEREKKQFEKMVEDGTIGQIVSQFKPWWIRERSKKVVFEVDDDQSQAVIDNNEIEMPSIAIDIPVFGDITKHPPSPCVSYNLLNILFSYCFTCHLHHGDIDSPEALAVMIDVSPHLSNNINSENVLDALNMTMDKIMEIHGQSIEFIICVIEDMKLILNGPKLCVKANPEVPEYILRALSHIRAMINKHKTSFLLKRRKKLLSCLEKKMQYLLSWSIQFGNHYLRINLCQIELFIESLKTKCVSSSPQSSNSIHLSGQDTSKSKLNIFKETVQK